MKNILNKNKGLSLLLAITIILTSILLPGPTVEATSEKVSSSISINDFVTQLVQTVKLDVSSDSDTAYIEAAKTAGILKEDDFSDYLQKITRTDAAVLLNRADEYLHGDKVKDQMLDFVLKKRISDIKKVPEAKREDVAKVFAKGIIKGYFNGYYIQNRSFKGNNYITESTARSFINLITNPDKRAKISPDGELIRTTNLPKNANKFDYILACYPNRFYEKKFEFMFTEHYKAGKRSTEFAAYPVEMKKTKFKTWNDEWPFTIEMDKYLNDWTDKAETYLKYLFNVNYKTVDDKWIKGLASCYVKSNRNKKQDIKNFYLKYMKKNKVVIESSIIAVEPSTLYDDCDYCMRAYVKYRITAKNINDKQYHLLYSQYPDLKNLKNGKWRTGIFDIRFGTNDGYQGDGAYWAIDELTRFNDAFNVPVK